MRLVNVNRNAFAQDNPSYTYVALGNGMVVQLQSSHSPQSVWFCFLSVFHSHLPQDQFQPQFPLRPHVSVARTCVNNT